VRVLRATAGFACLALALGLGSCAASPPPEASAGTAAGAQCELQVIVELRADVDVADAAVADDLQAATRVRLTPLRRLGSRFIVAELATDEPDADCRAAVARLRNDRRVISVEPDQVRRPHAR
jgi:hypothetical protein